MKKKTLVSVMAGLLALLMIFGLVMSIIPPQAFAASSSSIQSEIDDLEAQAAEIQQRKEELEAQRQQISADQDDIIAKKNAVDADLTILHQEINNITEQIKGYSQLIAEKQTELDEALKHQDELNIQYQERIRSMEEGGRISYWSVLFEAKSFSEFIGNVSMIADIAKADQEMMDELEAVAQEIESAQADLSQQKQGLEGQRSTLKTTRAELDAKSAEMSGILNELNGASAEVIALQDEYEAKEMEVSNAIAQKELEYNEALEREEEERRQQEEEEKNQGGGNEGGGGYEPIPPSNGWLYPLPYYCPITSDYGWRVNPISGRESFHSGVDLGAGFGTEIYASASGVVASAYYDDVFGNVVTVAHGDGLSTLYAHMTYFVVSAGETVSQGQLLGYVGSTGWSTGPHLHFGVYYNGQHVNPHDYIG